MNAVDLTYRTDLRELNDLNFARFDAKVGERLAELRAELRGEMDARFARADVTLAERLAKFRAEMDARFTQLEGRVRQAQVSTVKWMFVFWAGTGAMVLGWFVTRWLRP
jgi:hypothetical protein